MRTAIKKPTTNIISLVDYQRRVFAPNKAPEGIRYYDLIKNWPRVKPHLDDAELNDILVRDFNKFTEGHWGKKFRHGQFPREFENTDWDDSILDGIDTVDWDEADYDKFFRDFREPEYWRYVKHGASRWLVNFTRPETTISFASTLSNTRPLTA